MSWFKRQKAGINTKRSDQIDVPEGQWAKCPVTGEIINKRVLEENALVFPGSGYHMRMNSKGYFDLLFDDEAYDVYDTDLQPVDSLEFADKKSYTSRISAAQSKSGLSDAAVAAMGSVGGHQLSVAAMDFSFVGGSMGSVVGEVLSRAIKRAYTNEHPAVNYFSKWRR